MKEVKAYRCSFCGKIYLQRNSCEKHENNGCYRNMMLKPLCFACTHCKSAWDTETVQWVNKDNELKKYEFEIVRCTARGIRLFDGWKLPEQLKGRLKKKGYVEMPLVRDGCDELGGGVYEG